MSDYTDSLASAQRHYDAIKPEDVPADALESTLAQQLADWIEAGGWERLIALIDFVLDEHRLYERDDPLKTFQQWVDGGTGPRDETRIWNDDFDARR